LFRCWKNHQPYQEDLYQHALSRRTSPAVANSTVQVQWKSYGGMCKVAGISLD
jgi:hypothetical protein